MAAYYNEIDQFAAAWLRELIKAGHIAPGEVDTRSIADVMPSDLAGFTQCHFFAGIGVWSYALRQAGWPDDRPVWTGSCPCQPFSDAGKGKGFKDDRHLWPEFFRLISQCRPTVCFGEQVASKPGLAWIDLVQTDMENAGYAFGAVDTCSAGVGAPHIRQRLYWVADAQSIRSRAGLCNYESANGRWSVVANHSTTRRLADPGDNRSQRRVSRGQGEKRETINGQARCGSAAGRPGPVNGLWRDADWLLCRDGKWRAVEPGTFPLAHGAPARVGRLRGYGNALNAEQAKAFITAFMEVENG